MDPVSPRTYRRIDELTREVEIAGVSLRYCPCRLLPETVLGLKAVMEELQRLWSETLGDSTLERLQATLEGGRFFAGEARLCEIQPDRPDMVAVWLPFPPDYPGRLKVQLIDAVEPFEPPGDAA